VDKSFIDNANEYTLRLDVDCFVLSVY